MNADTSSITAERIEQTIFFCRGQKVILDLDLADLYGVQTRQLHRVLRGNRKRFPKSFLFRLSREEFASLTSKSRGDGVRRYAFTEHGIAMLSSILNDRQAIRVNSEIMRAFCQPTKQEDQPLRFQNGISKRQAQGSALVVRADVCDAETKQSRARFLQ